MENKRARILKDGHCVPGRPIVYWMSRDQRVDDNWALLFAASLAEKNRAYVKVIFYLADIFPGANLRHYDFMARGLSEVAEKLAKYNIPFTVLYGNLNKVVPGFLSKNNAGALVTDFDPLKTKAIWKEAVADAIKIPFYEVDAHNIVPVWTASDKKEFGAYTLRPKILRELHEYLVPFPKLKVQKHITKSCVKDNAGPDISRISVDGSVKPVKDIVPGEEAAKKTLKEFIKNKLSGYSKKRNMPDDDVSSGLSPYLHFGQISAQRVALLVRAEDVPNADKDAFLEQLIVRRELADNFCFYEKNYDNTKCFPAWAKSTLWYHRNDKREYLYTLKQFENAETHDELWNAAQKEMVLTGKMHGYMRMYWAKKILEWTKAPLEALKYAIYLNDRYSLDGRDPNGYTGIAWAIGGVHDRAFGERDIFGKVRYMSYNGCKGKFDIKKYMNKEQK